MKTNIGDNRLLRLKQIVPDIIPVGKSTWWAGVRAGRFPKPVKLSSRVTVWRASDIRALIEANRGDETLAELGAEK